MHNLTNYYRKVQVKLLSHVRLFATLWTVAHQAPQSMGFSRHEYWSGLSRPPPENDWSGSEKVIDFGRSELPASVQGWVPQPTSNPRSLGSRLDPAGPDCLQFRGLLRTITHKILNTSKSDILIWFWNLFPSVNLGLNYSAATCSVITVSQFTRGNDELLNKLCWGIFLSLLFSR